MRKDLPVVCRNIRAQRHKAGFSQDKLSKIAGTTLATITKIETGQTPDPRISTVKRLADALNITVAALCK